MNVQQDMVQGVFVAQQTSAQLDHRGLAAKLTNPTESFDERVCFFDRVIIVGHLIDCLFGHR